MRFLLLPLIGLILHSPVSMAQSSWEKATGNFPLPHHYFQSDGSPKVGRILQLKGRVVAWVKSSQPEQSDALISTTDGIHWDIFPEALHANRYDVTSKVENRRSFSNIDPGSYFQNQIPFGPVGRLEIIYRNADGTFKALGLTGHSLIIPSPDAIKIGNETSAELSILSGECVHFPELPLKRIEDIEILGDTPILHGGSQVFQWRNDLSKGGWTEIRSSNGFGFNLADNAPDSLAAGPNTAYLIEKLPTSPSVSLILDSGSALTRQPIDYQYEIGTLNAIGTDSTAFITVGGAAEKSYERTQGFIARKLFDSHPLDDDWETIRIPEIEEFLYVDYLESTWIATAKGGSIWGSSDGIFWAQVGQAPEDFVNIVAIDDRWVGRSDRGFIYSSTDLGNWNKQRNEPTNQADLAAIGNRFFYRRSYFLFTSPLALEGSPDITIQPLSQSILPGESPTLTVEAKGSDLQYQWYHGTPADKSNPIEGADQNSFTTPLLTADTDYWVEVFNSINRDESFITNVVIEFQPEIQVQPVSRTRDLSRFSTLSTSVKASGNGLTYQWYQGLPGDLSQPLTAETSSSFSKTTDSPGTTSYFVRVANRIGPIDSDPIQFTVNPVLAEITSEPEDQMVDPGRFISLRVSTSGPLVSYQWYRGASGDVSNPIPNETRTTFYPETDASPDEFYWVRVSNPVSFEDSRSARITVNYTIQEITIDTPIHPSVLAGSFQSIEGRVSNALGTSFQWFEGPTGDTSNPIGGETSRYFSVPREQVGEYSYWLQSSNPAGTSNSPTVSVTMIAPDYDEWVTFYNLREEVDDPKASAAGDEFTNIYRYLARLHPLAPASDAFTDFEIYHDPETDTDYFALRIRSRELPPGFSMIVEESLSLKFNGTLAIDTGVQTPHGDQTTSRLYRTSLPVSSAPHQFLRVRVTGTAQ
ncbi:MAG: hypothetical protein ACJA16_004413 [Akkermansiaceae bacterium]|jgi:hypothetical protein